MTISGAVDELCSVDTRLLDEIEEDVTEPPILVDPVFKSLADGIVTYLGIPQARNAAEASQQYFGIVQALDLMP